MHPLLKTPVVQMMADPTEAVSGLIERIERSGGPDRDLDAAIYHDLLGFCRHAKKERTGAQSDTGFDCMDCGADSWGNKSRKGGYPVGQGLHDSAPRYTASLDDAVTLVPDGWYWRAGHGVLWPGWAHLNVKHPDHCDYGDEHTAHAETPALALCAAALKARETTPPIKGDAS